MPCITNFNAKPLSHTINTSNEYDRKLVRHLYRRLGYGARLQDINAANGQTIDQLVESLINNASGVTFPQEFDWTNRLIDYPYTNDTNTATFRSFDNLIHNYWINELIQEGVHSKLTLFWRNHFVAAKSEFTSITYPIRYYKVLFNSAFGNFKSFVKRIGRTPLMLAYLNGARTVGEPSGQYSSTEYPNHVNPPDENYARELLELFTMGEVDKIGNKNYTEEDISALARVFSGWRAGFVDWGGGYLGVNINTFKATYGNNDGRITITANGGVGIIEYSIDNGVTFSTNNIFDNLPTGIYDVMVRDENNCGKQPRRAIIGTNGMTISTSVVNANANVGGQITITGVTGATTPLEYSIDNGVSFSSTNTFSNLPKGIYNIVVRDDNGSITTKGVNITNTDINTDLAISNIQVKPNSCYAMDGKITISASSSNEPLSYSIDNGATFSSSKTFKPLELGIYQVVVKDAADAKVTSSAVMWEKPQPASHRPNEGVEYEPLNGGQPAQYSIEYGSHDWKSKKFLFNTADNAYGEVDVEVQLNTLFEDPANPGTYHTSYTDLMNSKNADYGSWWNHSIAGTPLPSIAYINNPNTIDNIRYLKDSVTYYRAFETTKFHIGLITAANWEYNETHELIFRQREDVIAYFICKKLYEFYIYADTTRIENLQEGSQLDTYIENLAKVFKYGLGNINLNTFAVNAPLDPNVPRWVISDVLKVLFKSQHFYDAGIMGAQIKSHIGSAASLLRITDLQPGWGNYDSTANNYDYVHRFTLLDDSAPSPGVIAMTGEGAPQQEVAEGQDLLKNSHPILIKNECAKIGQNLDAPPNVGGWKEHRLWLNEDAIIKRRLLLYRLLKEELTDGAKEKFRQLAMALYDNEPIGSTPVGDPTIYEDANHTVKTMWRHFICTEPTDRQITDAVAVFTRNFPYPGDPRLDGCYATPDGQTFCFDAIKNEIAERVVNLIIHFTEQPEWHLT